MSIKKVVAIIDELQLKAIEQALGKHGITGFSTHPVRGRGSYCNTFSRNALVTHIQIEIYSSEKHAKKIAEMIMKIAHVGADSEGIVAITSVDELFWVSRESAVSSEEFNYFEDVSEN